MKDPLNINPQSILNKRIRNIIKEKLSITVTPVDLLLKSMTGYGVSRYGVTTDIAFAACLVIDEELQKPKKKVLGDFGNLLAQINYAWAQKVQNQFMEEVLKNVETDIRYNKVQLRNTVVSDITVRAGFDSIVQITRRNTLVTPYFSVLQNDEQTKALNAGYINNQNPFVSYYS